jgi:hypothetical protein
MKILLDECVPSPMHRLLTHHSCTNVQAQGWGGIKNGELLRLAETEFDLFITSIRIFGTNRTSQDATSPSSNSRQMILSVSRQPRY